MEMNIKKFIRESAKLMFLGTCSFFALSLFGRAEDVKIKGLPQNLFQAIPKETDADIDALLRAAASYSTENEYSKGLDELYKKHENYLTERTSKMCLTVKNKKGKNIPLAKVFVSQILNENSERDDERYPDPRTDTKAITDWNGQTVVKNLSSFNPHLLIYYLAAGKIPRDNFTVTIKAGGYKEKKVGFVSIDRESLAFSTRLLPYFLALFNTSEKGKKFICAKEDFTIPKEYTAEMITLEVILEEEEPDNSVRH